jgi:AcrR family transcriptional regulator
MSRPAPNAPRKLPTQARAKATVEAILAATARLLRREGYEALSTNRVAEVAGVSVGSLYQYFPSKEALALAVMDQHCDALGATLEGRLVELAHAELEVVAQALVEEMISLHRTDPRLHQALLQLQSQLGKSSKMDQLQRRFITLVQAYLEAHRRELAVEDVALAAHLLVVSVEALTHSAVSAHPELLHSEAFSQELVRMALRYLAPHRAERTTRDRKGYRPAWASR